MKDLPRSGRSFKLSNKKINCLVESMNNQYSLDSLDCKEGHMKRISRLFVCVCGRSTVRLQEKRSDLLVFVRHLRQEKGD